jgi:hypothetical protein
MNNFCGVWSIHFPNNECYRATNRKGRLFITSDDLPMVKFLSDSSGDESNFRAVQISDTEITFIIFYGGRVRSFHGTLHPPEDGGPIIPCEPDGACMSGKFGPVASQGNALLILDADPDDWTGNRPPIT